MLYQVLEKEETVQKGDIALTPTTIADTFFGDKAGSFGPNIQILRPYKQPEQYPSQQEVNDEIREHLREILSILRRLKV